VARAMMRVDHEHLQDHVVGERDEAFIMVMEHCDGGDLREAVQPHVARAVRVAREVRRDWPSRRATGSCMATSASNVMFDATADQGHRFRLPEHYTNEGSTQRNWYAHPRAAVARGRLFSLGAVVYEMLFAARRPNRSRTR